MEDFVTLLFIKVEGQNLADWGILMCAFQKTISVYQKDLVTLPFLMEEAQNFVSCIILMCFLRI